MRVRSPSLWLRAAFLPVSSAWLLVGCATSAGNAPIDSGPLFTLDSGSRADRTIFGDAGTDAGQTLPGMDGSIFHDAGMKDATTLLDAGFDANGANDASPADATLQDGGAHDGGADAMTSHDGGRRDGSQGSPDAHPEDTGVHDAGVHDGAAHDAGARDGGGMDSGSATCALNHLVISQIQSRGANGGSDEWIDLYNPSSAAVILDATWALAARSNSGASFTARWAGSGKSLPAHGHFLIAGTAYPGAPVKDDALSSGITDATALRLTHAGVTVDEVCYAYSAATTMALEGAGYACPGTPVQNPHDDTTATDTAESLERKPGGAAGNCTDTGDPSADFKTTSPSAPLDTGSAPTP